MNPWGKKKYKHNQLIKELFVCTQLDQLMLQFREGLISLWCNFCCILCKSVGYETMVNSLWDTYGLHNHSFVLEGLPALTT